MMKLGSVVDAIFIVIFTVLLSLKQRVVGLADCSRHIMLSTSKYDIYIVIAVFTLVSVQSDIAYAEGPDVPHIFQGGEPAIADHVNENFKELANRIQLNTDSIQNADSTAILENQQAIERNAEAILKNQGDIDNNTQGISSNLEKIEINTRALENVAVFPSFDYHNYIATTDISEKLFLIEHSRWNSDPENLCDREKHIYTRDDTGSVPVVSVEINRFESAEPPFSPDVQTCNLRPGLDGPVEINFGKTRINHYEVGAQYYSLTRRQYDLFQGGVLTSFEEIYEVPVPVLTSNMRLGLPWIFQEKYTQSNNIDSETYTSWRRISGMLLSFEESVVVNGTTYTGCLKTNLKRLQDGAHSFDRLIWYCQGVGAVKIMHLNVNGGTGSKVWTLLQITRTPPP